jgi:hypothetical protein
MTFVARQLIFGVGGGGGCQRESLMRYAHTKKSCAFKFIEAFKNNNLKQFPEIFVDSAHCLGCDFWQKFHEV